MVRFLPLLIILGVTIYALFDWASTPEDEVRNLPKPVWLLVIIVVVFFGGIAWLVAGRSVKPRGTPKKRKIIPPDDDPDFLRSI